MSFFAVIIDKISDPSMFRSNWPLNTIRLVTIIPSLIILVIVLFQPWVDPKLMFFDPLVAAEVADECCSVAFGFMSQLGIMIWIATASICLFSGILMIFDETLKKFSSFALSAGILTGWLAIDDAFLLHEKVFPILGVSQNVVLSSYILLTLIYLAMSWRIIINSDYLLLILGGIGFTVSLLIDIVLHTPIWVYLEDSGKFFGICCWAAFHISTLARLQKK